MSSMHQKGYMPWDRNGNRLLLQSELGKNKASIYDLPEESFVYGKLTYDDPEKANELIYKWKEHNNSVNANQGKVKDLIETNKKCITNQLHTASHFYQFRKTNTHFQTPREGSTQIKMVLPEESHAYGKPLEYNCCNSVFKTPSGLSWRITMEKTIKSAGTPSIKLNPTKVRSQESYPAIS